MEALLFYIVRSQQLITFEFAAELASYRKSSDVLKEDMEKYGFKVMPKLDDLKSEKNVLIAELEKTEAASAQNKQSLDELQILMDNYNKLIDQKLCIKNNLTINTSMK